MARSFMQLRRRSRARLTLGQPGIDRNSIFSIDGALPLCIGSPLTGLGGYRTDQRAVALMRRQPARGNQALQRISHRVENRYLLVQLFDLAGRELLSPIAVAGTAFGQVKKGLDLGEREAELLCALDKS